MQLSVPESEDAAKQKAADDHYETKLQQAIKKSKESLAKKVEKEKLAKESKEKNQTTKD